MVAQLMTIVVLAAGASRRMGTTKLLLPIDGRPIIEHVLRAAAGWPIVVVAGERVASTLDPRGLRVVKNAAPERGMSHSLALADAAIDAAQPIAVLLADLPDITPAAIAAALEAYDDSIDVVVPRCGELYAHPVVFGPRARRKIGALPDGDTLKHLRDDPALRRRFIETDAGALRDIDTPLDYARRTGASDSGKGRLT
jgi:molybdenum cofactor cytidylyltransferase